MSGTKQKLLEGALQAIREQGIAGVSARTIAAAAGVNQALVFYHFGSVDELLIAACAEENKARVSEYAQQFATVGSLRELLRVGQALHDAERERGNVSVLAQLLAGAQTDPKLAGATAAALALWTEQLEIVLHRVLDGSPVAEIADVPGLARAVAAAFVGFELFEGVDPEGGRAALSALDQLAVLVEVVDELGPIARRALQAKVNRVIRRR